MKVVLAFDKFKGSVSAIKVCELVKQGLLKVRPDLDIVMMPLADGGEGTAEALITAQGGNWFEANVMGPLPDMIIQSRYGWINNSKTAIVEMASASGLALISKSQRNPLRTTTYGTGQLICKALKRNPSQILLTVGGSATVDGGVGAAMAVGWKFLDAHGQSIGLGGGELAKIKSIVSPSLSLPSVRVLCDVSNKLTGTDGATEVFGPQKGATPEMAAILERNLKHLSQIIRERLGIEIENIPMSGAAGGLAGGAVAFFNAELVSGAEIVIKATQLEESLKGAAWVITGEGSFDQQSLQGKVISGVCRAAKRTGSKVGVIAGISQIDSMTAKSIDIEAIVTCCGPGITEEYAMSNAEQLVRERAIEFAQNNLR